MTNYDRSADARYFGTSLDDGNIGQGFRTAFLLELAGALVIGVIITLILSIGGLP